MSKLSPEEIKRVKGLGCLKDKRYDDVFNVRVLTGNGKLASAKHRVVAEAAEKYGSGEVCLTSRMTFEIQGVRYENIDALRSFLSENGLETGGTGNKVRPVVCCKGTTCGYGLIDTFGLCEQIHERFYVGYHDVPLPHKFKIGIGGCPNNCVKPDLNDVGIIGQCVPRVDPDVCRGCPKCQIEVGCPVHAAKVVDGTLTIDENKCNHCGRCMGKCPFGAVSEEVRGYRICIGGRWGKSGNRGQALNRVFLSEAEVLDALERIILFYRDHGTAGERFADTINRLGFEAVEKTVLE